MQSMAATAAIPELADRLDSVIGNLNDTIRQIRTSIFQLQNSDSAPSGVRSIVVEIIDQITPALGFMPMTRFHGPLDTVVAAAELDAIAAVVREAVTNVAKHAQATELDVELTVDGNQLTVDVSDNGIGSRRQRQSAPQWPRQPETTRRHLGRHPHPHRKPAPRNPTRLDDPPPLEVRNPSGRAHTAHTEVSSHSDHVSDSPTRNLLASVAASG